MILRDGNFDYCCKDLDAESVVFLPNEYHEVKDKKFLKSSGVLVQRGKKRQVERLEARFEKAIQ